MNNDRRTAAGRSYFDTVRSMTADPELLAAVDRAEAATTAACEHGPDCLRVGCHLEDEPEGIPTTTEMGGWPLLVALGVIAVVAAVIMMAVFN